MSGGLSPRFCVLAGICVTAIAARLLPHPANFTPIVAIALFGGAHFTRPAVAFAVPLVAMLLSDAALELMFGWGFHTEMPVVYASFAAVVGIGFLLSGRRRVLPIAVATLASSTLFYLTTNLAVWAMGTTYPRTPTGLVACYVAAVPFFGNMVAGDLFYAAVLFGGFALAQRRFPILALPKIA